MVNHLARMHLFVDAAAGRPYPAYEIHWRFYPNLAMDIIVPTLARFVSVETAARLFLLASQTLVVSGAIALEIAIRGRHQLSGFARTDRAVQPAVRLGTDELWVRLWRCIMGYRVLDSLPRQAWVCLDRISCGLCRPAVCYAFDRARHLTIGCYEAGRIVGYRQAARTFAVMAFPVVVLYLCLIWSGGAIGKAVFDWWFIFKLTCRYWL